MTGKMLIIIFLGIAVVVVVVNKFLTFREGFDDDDSIPCVGKAKGCYQLQEEGNLVLAPRTNSMAPSGGWTEESCMDTSLLDLGKWCGGAVAVAADTPNGCPLPKEFSTGVIGGDTTSCIAGSLLSSGKKCDVKCDTGYKILSGTKEYSCNNGAMTNGTLKCGPISCKIPASLGKGIRSAPFKGCAAGDSLGAGKTCSVECERGYKVESGNDAYACSEVGVLSKASLECNPITCKLPDYFGDYVEGAGSGGCEVAGTLLGGASCMTSCLPGYQMQTGDGGYSCSAGGVLRNGNLSCVKKKGGIEGESGEENIELIEEKKITQNITFICDPEESPMPIHDHSLATYSQSSHSPAPVRARGVSSSGAMHRIPSSRSVRIPGAATVRPYDSLMNW